MIIDANIFIGESLYGNSLSVKDLKMLMKKNNLDKVVVRPLKPYDFNYDKANQYIAKVQEKNNNIIGFGRVNPLEKNAPNYVRKAIKEYGLKGIHLHPWEDNFYISSEVVNNVMDVIAQENIIIYISAGYPIVSEPLQILELMQRYPTVTAIVTHGCQLDISGLSFDDALIVAEKAKNVKFDISGVYRRDFIELLVDHAGEENVLFGSCAPYMDISLEIERIKAVQIPKDIKDKIFYKNIEKVLS